MAKSVPFKTTPEEFQKKTVGIRDDTKIVEINGDYLLPITGVHHKHPMNFSQDINNYTSKGREKIHKNLVLVSAEELHAVSRCRDPNEALDFNDNRLSAFVQHQGKSYITGNMLILDDMISFRKKPLKKGGTNRHGNIAFVESAVYKALFTKDSDSARNMMMKFNLSLSQWKRFNYLRHNYNYREVRLNNTFPICRTIECRQKGLRPFWADRAYA